MKITRIKYTKNKLFAIYIDDNYAFSVDENLLFSYKLKEQMELPEEEYEALAHDAQLLMARLQMLRMLSNSKTRREVEDKLRAADFAEDIVKECTDFAEEYGYLNDEEYARLYVQDKMNLRQWGPLRIRQELQRKGIAREVITLALEEMQGGEEENLRTLAAQLLDRVDWQDRKQVDKCKQKLYGRGYTFDSINHAVREEIDRRRCEMIED